MKTTKEDIMGLVKAVELFVALDHAAVTHGWEQEVQQVIDQLGGTPGVCVVRDLARYSEGIPVARIEIDAAVCGRNVADIAQELAAGDPAIRVAQHGDWLSINPQFMEAGDVEFVITGLRQVLNG
jgi:D-glucosaminate-6-phosphate ammonia-lyase